MQSSSVRVITVSLVAEHSLLIAAGGQAALRSSSGARANGAPGGAEAARGRGLRPRCPTRSRCRPTSQTGRLARTFQQPAPSVLASVKRNIVVLLNLVPASALFDNIHHFPLTLYFIHLGRERRPKHNCECYHGDVGRLP